jgi:type IV secretory pathway VirB6-like protein
MIPVTLSLNGLTLFLATLLDEPGNLFLRSGENIFFALATILIVWHGIETALSGVDARQTARLLFALVCAFTMLHYYNTPIPGIGYSFIDMFRMQTIAMSLELSGTGAQLLEDQARQLMLSVPIPPLMQIHVAAVYLMVYALAALLTVAVFCVVAFGAIGQAVCFILGPLFLPWFLVPKLDFLFWGWLKAVLQFSFYKVVAAIVIEIVAQFQLTILSPTAATASMSDFILDWPIRAAACLISVLLIFHVPGITNSIFSGATGSGGVLGTLTAVAVVARNYAIKGAKAVAGASTGGATVAAAAVTSVAVNAAASAAKSVGESGSGRDAASTASHTEKQGADKPGPTKTNGGDR